MGITKREEVPQRSSILSHILFPTSITHGVYVFLNLGSTYYPASPATALLYTEIINGEGITISLPLPSTQSPSFFSIQICLFLYL